MPMPQAEYARRRGCSGESVSKAIRVGRLRASIMLVNGVPQIADPDLADREWTENTQTKVRSKARGATARVETGDRQARTEEHPGNVPNVPDYHAARARRETALAELAEIELAEKRGQLVSAAEAEARWEETVVLIKTKILGVPSRMAQRMSDLPDGAVDLLDDLLREALEEIAGGDTVDE